MSLQAPVLITSDDEDAGTSHGEDPIRRPVAMISQSHKRVVDSDNEEGAVPAPVGSIENDQVCVVDKLSLHNVPHPFVSKASRASASSETREAGPARRTQESGKVRVPHHYV